MFFEMMALPEGVEVLMAVDPVTIGAGALALINLLKGGQQQGKANELTDEAVRQALAKDRQLGPLRDAFVSGALQPIPEAPDLSSAYADPSNPFFRALDRSQHIGSAIPTRGPTPINPPPTIRDRATPVTPDVPPSIERGGDFSGTRPFGGTPNDPSNDPFAGEPEAPGEFGFLPPSEGAPPGRIPFQPRPGFEPFGNVPGVPTTNLPPGGFGTASDPSNFLPPRIEDGFPDQELAPGDTVPGLLPIRGPTLPRAPRLPRLPTGQRAF